MERDPKGPDERDNALCRAAGRAVAAEGRLGPFRLGAAVGPRPALAALPSECRT